MSGTVTVIEQPVSVTVSPPQTVTVTETPVRVEVTVDGNVTVTEAPTTVTVTGGDTVLVQEVPVTVEVGSADHPAGHDIGGSDHTGVITAAQHGTPAGDLHTGHALLAGRAGVANNIKLSTDLTGIITGSGASAGKLRLIGTDHATPGLVEVQRASVTASTQMFQGLIGAEAQPRWAFGFDATSLVQLGLGVGGATAMDVFLKRTAARALRLVSNHATLLPSLGARDSNDTADSWTLDRQTGLGANIHRGRLLLGGDGATAPDAGFRRGANPGEVRVVDYLLLPNMVTAPSPPVPALDEGVELPIYLYAASGGVSGLKASLYFRADTGQFLQEVGPIGTVRGLHRRTDLAIGGFAVNNADGAAIEGVNFWGLLAGATASGSSSNNVAYSPARSLTNNITATEIFFGITGGVVPPGDVIVIGTEKIQVVQTALGPDSLHCLRGAYGTTAQAHLAGAPILFAGGANRTLFGSDGEAAFEQTTGTAANTNAGLVWPYSHCYHSEPMQIYKFDLRHVTDIRFFLGFTDAGPTATAAENTMLGSDNPAGNYWGIQFSTGRGDTEFKAVAKDGTTQNLQATGWGTPLANTKYYVVLEKQGGADPTVSLFDLSWAPIGGPISLTTNLPPPDSARQRLLCSIRNPAGGDKRIRHFHGTFVPSPSVA